MLIIYKPMILDNAQLEYIYRWPSPVPVSLPLCSNYQPTSLLIQWADERYNICSTEFACECIYMMLSRDVQSVDAVRTEYSRRRRSI